MWDWLRRGLLDVALKAAKRFGLTDTGMDRALALVRQAQDMPEGNDARREWAVRMLMQILHLRESVARLAVELAVVLIKWQTEQQPHPTA